MDVNNARKIRSLAIIKPVVIGKLSPFFGNGYQLTGAGMVQMVSRFFFRPKDRFHAGHLLRQLPDGRELGRVVHIDMGQLVVGQRKSLTGSSIQ